MRRIRRTRIALLGAILALLATGSAWAAFQGLPADNSQVNNDATAGINPADPVDISDDPANSDVTGGSLAGGVEVPWAVFRQKETVAGKPDQIFSRSFAAGKWTTRGAGTTGGHSDSGPSHHFDGSLNFDQDQEGEAPSIDFAGPNRATPWATWYEPNSTFGHEQIFTSRFDPASNKWIFSGQDRGSGVPSLNINTNQDAENPVVAGGSTADPTKPGPWIAWQEQDANGTGTSDQIFVSKPTGGRTDCAGFKPSTGNPIGGFCFQQVGIERVNTNHDPSLNVDPTREGIEPDIAFTGAADSVPWVVWYETGTGAFANGTEQVFAAKGVAPSATTPPTGTVDGGLNWVAVGGNGNTGTLDVTGHSPCLVSLVAEQGCTLNASPTADAVDPRVAAGTMTAGSATVPWVAWEEAFGGKERIFVSRLVNGVFKIANGGQPLPTLVGGIDAKRPDITFSGNTPYVSWHEGTSVVSGHFTTPDSFVIDNGAVGTATSEAVRAPISSGCTANPFNVDGATCQASAVGTPFFLFTDGGPTDAKLFGKAYQTDAPVTGGSSSASATAAIVSATVNPQGAPVNVQFEYGPTTAYEQTTGLQHLGPANTATSFAGLLTGLPAATVIHYRAVAITDFGKVVGGDQSLTTASAPPPPKDIKPPHLTLSISKTTIKKLLKAKVLKVKVTIDEAGKVSLSASAKAKLKTKSKTVTIGKKSVSFTKAGSKTVSIKLSAAARRTLRHAKSATAKVTAKGTDLSGNKSTKKASRTLKHG